MNNISESILKFFKLDGLVQNLTGYVENRIELLKIEVKEDVASAMAHTLLIMVLFLLGFLFLIFVSIGGAHFLNQYLQATYAGYWIVAGLYGFFFLLLLLLRKPLHRYFEAYLAQMMKSKKNKHGTS